MGDGGEHTRNLVTPDGQTGTQNVTNDNLYPDAKGNDAIWAEPTWGIIQWLCGKASNCEKETQQRDEDDNLDDMNIYGFQPVQPGKETDKSSHEKHQTKETEHRTGFRDDLRVVYRVVCAESAKTQCRGKKTASRPQDCPIKCHGRMLVQRPN
jgi:hypothetical protein